MTKDFRVYTHGESRTAGGEFVTFSCAPEDRETVGQFLATKVRTVNVPPVFQSQVEHGGYTFCSRYKIKQKMYAAGGSSFIELLEISDPPDGKAGFVIYERHSPDARSFSEWRSLEEAAQAYHSCHGHRNELPGFIREVVCGPLTPWFYALGDEEIVGDYAVPHGLQDDPIYRLGRRFVVTEGYPPIPAIKTCVGARVAEVKRGFNETPKVTRTVFFDDGTTWSSESGPGRVPTPADEGEIWIAEAVEEFRALLAGYKTEFEIPLGDGDKFIGRVKLKRGRPKSRPEGRYSVRVSAANKDGVREGWVDFSPTPETPDLESHIRALAAREGYELESLKVEVKDAKPLRKGRKWAGVHKTSD